MLNSSSSFYSLNRNATQKAMPNLDFLQNCSQMIFSHKRFIIHKIRSKSKCTLFYHTVLQFIGTFSMQSITLCTMDLVLGSFYTWQSRLCERLFSLHIYMWIKKHLNYYAYTGSNEMFVGFLLLFFHFRVLGWLLFLLFGFWCVWFHFVCFPYRFYAVLKYHTQNINFAIMNIITIIVFIYTHILIWRVSLHILVWRKSRRANKRDARWRRERERRHTHTHKI